jgi:MFS family permease
VPDAVSPARGRRAVAGTFLLNGFGMATWFTEIPRFSERFTLSPGVLAFALVAPTVGALASMQVVGPLTARVGSRTVARAASVLLPLALLGVPFAPGVWPAIAALLVFGAIDGAFDVSANEQGVRVERAIGRPVLNGVHAAWGIGAILGGAFSSAAFSFGLSSAWHITVVAAVIVPLGWLCGRYLLPGVEPELPVDDSVTPPPWRRGLAAWLSGWTPKVLVLGGIGAAGMLAEGAVSNWVGVYLLDHKGAVAATASAAYTVFTLTETLARLAGDRATERFGPVRLVGAGTVLFTAGLLITLLSSDVWVAIGGLVLAGIGVAPINPLAFSAVGHLSADDGRTASAIGHFTTLSYGGLLGGPAIIGAVASFAGLPLALAVTLIPMAFIAVTAPALGPRPARSRAAPVEPPVRPG